MRKPGHAQYWVATTIAIVALSGGLLLFGQQNRRVNDALLKTGSPNGEEWVSHSVNWAEQRYSPLNQITAENISRLGVAGSYEIPFAPPPNGAGNIEAHQEATPLVFNGVLYGITPWSVTYAMDLRTKKELWRADPAVDQNIWRSRICCGVVNRGLALYEGKVIAPVVDGRLRALDAATGKVLWEVRVSPDNQAYTITMAPRVIKGGRVIIGVSGGEYAVRGFFSAYNVNDGKMQWRFYTVPGDPSKPFEDEAMEKASKTWDVSKKVWELGGGGGVWNGLAYDPDNDLVYVGTGQPGPWTDYWRGPGDNLYCNSIVAVKGSTGKLVWYYQEVPGDNWDFDSIADLMLLDLQIGGRTRQVIIHAPKSGFFYVLDRKTGEFISGDPITKVSWATGIDAKSGKPQVNPDARYKTDTVSVKPGPSGGHVWQPWSYSPQTKLVYFPGTAGGSYPGRADPNFVPQSTIIESGQRGRQQMGTGGGGGGGRGGAGGAGGRGGQAGAAGQAGQRGQGQADVLPAAVAAATGNATAPAANAAPRPPLPEIGPDGVNGSVLYAWDPVARKEKWRAAGGGAGPFAGGSISTAGNLVFSSVNSNLRAYNATTGQQVLDLNLYMNQMGPPISIMLDGKQYIIVTGAPSAGGGGGRGGAGGGAGGGRGGGAGAPAAGGQAPAAGAQAPAPQAGGQAPPVAAVPAAPRPAHLLMLALDAKEPIPGAPTN